MAITGKNILAGIRCGKAVSFENMAVAPLLRSKEKPEGPDYLILREAFEENVLRVTETSENGSVPELSVRNTGRLPVLILDGEELAGAKQNRVVNSSILIPPETKLIVPVSCTEAGRWEYRSAAFSDSDIIMSSNIRAKKSRSVSENLKASSSFRSDQGEVWNEIEIEANAYGVQSPTAAMKDTYEKHRDFMNEYTEKFRCVEGQAGCMVFQNGKPAGVELLSRPEKYAMLHEKILRSYAISKLRITRDADYTDYSHNSEHGQQGKHSNDTDYSVSQKEFESELSGIMAVDAACFPSVGLGDDCRLREENIAGSALRYEEETIHAAVFWLDDDRQKEKERKRRQFHEGVMSSYRERRDRATYE